MNLQRELLAQIRKADYDFNLIENNDKILVGVSLGKDSMLLCYLLNLYQKFNNKHFTFSAVFLDLGFGYDEDSFNKVKEFFTKNKIDFIVTDEQQVSKILSLHKKENGNLPCSICSRMKKACINKVANKLGFNKVCFAHHMDDAIETLFLNMSYGGKVNTFEPKMHLSKANVTFIRPMIYIREKDIERAVKQFKIPTSKNKCPNDKNTEREEFKNFLNSYYKEFPDAYINFANMLTNEEHFKLFFNHFGFKIDDYFIKKVINKNDYIDTMKIRHEVFIKEQNISYEDEIDDKEQISTFFNIYHKNEVVGTIRCYFEEDNLIHIGRFAIKKEYRNKHLGTNLLNYVIYYFTIRTTPLTFKLNAQLDKVDFYKKFGFEIIPNSENIDANIKHIEMIKKFNQPISKKNIVKDIIEN